VRVARPGVVVAHLFPEFGAIFGTGSRFVGRVVDVEERRLEIDLAIPDDEADPMAYAAGLGTDTRAVVVQDGRVLWEARVRVERFLAGADRTSLRVVVHAVRAPSPRMARAFAPAAAPA